MIPKRNGTPILVHQQLTRSSPFATSDTSSPTSLVNRARRRLQYSQLPVRCNSNSKRSTHQQQQQQGRFASSLKKFPILGTSAKRTVSAKSCNVKDSPVSADKRKSLSMIDLTPTIIGTGDYEPCELRSDSGTTLASEGTMSIEAQALATWTSFNPTLRLEDLEREAHESRAASLVCRALVINAWRRRRIEVIDLRSNLNELTQQVDHLQIQIVVLRRLLDKENERVSNLAGDLHRARTQIDEMSREREQLKAEKIKAMEEIEKVREISEERSVTAENLRNELKTAKDQLDALDKQISRDREKIVKLREDKKILLEKVSSCEALVIERGEHADRTELSLEDAQMQLATQIVLTNSLQEEVDRFSDLIKSKEDEKFKLEQKLYKIEEEYMILEERLKENGETERRLSLRAADLESMLFDQESKIKRLEMAYNVQMLELNELRERFIQRSEDNGWSSRVLQLAGSVARAPRVILRTLSFFSTGLLHIL